MNVSLPPEMERLIQDKVESGLYLTASDVVQEGLRLLFRRDDFDEEEVARIRAEIQIGLDELDHGEVVPMDDAFAEAREIIAAHRKGG
jgi:antitoxin ParD1/3/4